VVEVQFPNKQQQHMSLEKSKQNSFINSPPKKKSSLGISPFILISRTHIFIIQRIWFFLFVNIIQKKKEENHLLNTYLFVRKKKNS
jgi:hypothetical protein